MPEPTIHRTLTERITIDLDQDQLELAVAHWLMDRHGKVFAGVFFKFEWSGDQLPSVSVTGEKINYDVTGERIYDV